MYPQQLTEELASSKDSLSSAASANKALCEQLRVYQESYVAKVCRMYDVDPKQVRKSISLKTTLDTFPSSSLLYPLTSTFSSLT